jgi:Integrase core domain
VNGSIGRLITVTLTAAQSPWQNAYVERLIGSVRRECLDHVIVLNESGLRRILRLYFDYSERARTHLSLAKDAVWSKNPSCPLPYARTSLQAQVHDKSGSLDPFLGPGCTHPYICARLPRMTSCPYFYAYAASLS